MQAASDEDADSGASTQRTAKNCAGQYASKLVKSHIALTDGTLWEDYQLLVTGHAVYLPNFLCTSNDFSILTALTEDLKKNRDDKMTNWSKHFKHENPDFSPTFQDIVNKMADYFDLEVYATRLNFYPNSTSWKPFHHDSHAYEGREKREDFTTGASFGASRELVFLHPPSGRTFAFPQSNGDIFAFNNKVNKKFQHGVPKSTVRGVKSGPRFSIIAWGRRRSLNERNAGEDEIKSQSVLLPSLPGPARAASSPLSRSTEGNNNNTQNRTQHEDDDNEDDDEQNKTNKKTQARLAVAPMSAYEQREAQQAKNEVKVDVDEVTGLVETFVLSNTKQPPAQQQQRSAAAGGRGGGGGRGRGRNQRINVQRPANNKK